MIEIHTDYTEDDLARFEGRYGTPVDFSLIHAWTKGAEESEYGRGVRALAIEDGNPIALAQGVLQKRKAFRKLSCGSNSSFGTLWLAGREDAAADCLTSLAERTRSSIIEVFSPTPLELPGVSWEQAYTFHIDLRKPRDTILDEMKREAKKKVRRAERLGVSAEVVEDQPHVEQAYDLIHKSADTRKFPVPPKSYSLALHREFAQSGYQGCAVARLDGKIVAAAALLGYGKKVAWWKGGSSAEGYKTSAGNLLQLSAIDWAKQCGFETYDLGGTHPKQPKYRGIHEFKSSLGGALVKSSVGNRSTAAARLARKVAGSLR